MPLPFILFLKADFSESSGILSIFHMFTKKTINFLSINTQRQSSSDQPIWLFNSSDNSTAFLLYSTLKFCPLIISINYDNELLYSWSFYWRLRWKKHWLPLSLDAKLQLSFIFDMKDIQSNFFLLWPSYNSYMLLLVWFHACIFVLYFLVYP